MRRARQSFQRSATQTTFKRGNINYPIFTITGSPPPSGQEQKDQTVIQPEYYLPDWNYYVQLNTSQPIQERQQYRVFNIRNTYVFTLIENGIPVLVSIQSQVPPLTLGIDGENILYKYGLCWKWDDSLNFYILQSEKGYQFLPFNLYIINKNDKKKYDKNILHDLELMQYQELWRPYITKIYPVDYSDSLKKFNIPYYGNANAII